MTLKLETGQEVQELNLGCGDTCRLYETEVSFAQAYGPELKWIRENISGIPMSKGFVVRWFGSDAQFIAANWGG